jgi:hypothetical protein
LTVSDIEGFSQKGGMVEFAVGKDQRVHLYINRNNAEKVRLKIDNRLLNLSEIGRPQ